MSGGGFAFNGVTLIACASGALYIPALEILAVSDLHLEKGSAHARRGRLLPPYDSRATLRALAAAVAEHDPRRVICLGDSFDDRGAGARLGAEDLARLHALVDGREWIWIAGNHDPAPPAIGGVCLSHYAAGPYLFRHIADEDAAPGEISGHYHPKASVAVLGRRLTRRCFVTDGARLIVPAFGAYTGGLDVFSPALAALLKPSFFVHLLGQTRVRALPSHRLVGGGGVSAAARSR